MSGLTIRARLIGLISVMVILIASAGTMFVLEKSEQAESAGHVAEMVRFSGTVGNLVHEMQKERGSSSVFIGSKGQRFGAELRAQRADTDKSLAIFRDAVAQLKTADQGVQQQTKDILALLEKIGPHRGVVDALSIDAPSSAVPFTQAISNLLKIAEGISANAADPAISQQLIGYVDFLQGKERAGQERAAAGAFFGAGKFTAEGIRRIAVLAGAQDAFFSAFAISAPADIVLQYKAVEATKGADVTRLRQIATESVASGNVGDVTGPGWFATSTARIEGLKSVEDAAAERLVRDAMRLEGNASSTQWTATIALSMMLASVLGLAIVNIRFIGRALGDLRDAIRQVEQTGNLSLRAPVNGKDEISQTASAFNALLIEIDGTMRAINATMESVAASDLTARVDFAAKGDAGRLKNNINLSLEKVAGSLRAVANNIRQVATAARETQVAINHISSGAQGQLNALGQVSIAIEQTSRAVTDVADNARLSSEYAQKSAHLVRTGSEQMDGMVEVVTAIAASGEQIGKITDAISLIADRTNMLSLNASIEAAHAGQKNKGFAVVAEEVGRLADHSGKSVREINHLILKAAQETSRGVEMSQRVKTSISQIAVGVEEAESMAGAIAAAIEQQQAAVTEIRMSMQDLNRIGELNASAAEEINATMGELTQLSAQTNTELQRFRF